MQLSIYVLLLAIGFVSASIGKVVDIVASSLLHVRALIPTLPGELWQIYLLWVGWSVALTMVAVLVTRKISTKAKGSGIPQMKSVLAGGNMSEEFLSVRCLVAKVLGLTAALSGGLSIGKEGPWVHFAAIVANLISKLDVFTHLNKSKLDWQKILSAGFAAGTAANFGAPVGGVLFSIEVTASHYLVRNYYPAFFCTWSAAFCFRLLNIRNKHGHGGKHDTALFSHAGHFAYDRRELLAFAVLGVAAGLLGALFVHSHRRFVRWQQERKTQRKRVIKLNDYTWAAVVAVITATVSFPGMIGDFMSLSDARLVDDLFSHHELDDSAYHRNSRDWSGSGTHGHGVAFSLCCVIVLRFLLTMASISLPLPCGLYSPVFVIGCALGRLFGKGVMDIFPEGLQAAAGAGAGAAVAEVVMPGGYAVVGAAAFSAGVTRTVSSAVFVFELTGSLHNLLPVLTAVIISIGVANMFTPGIYESLLDINRLPYFYNAYSSAAFLKTTHRNRPNRNKTAADVMFLNNSFVQAETTMGELDQTVRRHARDSAVELAIIMGADTMLVVGSIRVSDLIALVDRASKADSTHWHTQAVHFLREESFKHIVRTPFSVLEGVPVSVIETYFGMLRLEVVFVTRLGQLLGTITKESVMEHP